MIWLTWRQLRVQATTVLAVVIAFAVVLVVTGRRLLDTYHLGAHTFLSEIQFNRLDQTLYHAGVVVLYVLPPVVGAFWGAPLVARELESGTHRLAWNQSITRSRWLATKLALAAAAAVVAVGIVSLAVSWWASPIDREIGKGHGSGPFSLPRIAPLVFGGRGVVPVGYTLLALALGVTVGIVLRRSVPAIAVTLALVVAAQVAMPFLVRPHLAAPTVVTAKISASNLRGITMRADPRTDRPYGPVRNLQIAAGGPGDWMLSNQSVDAQGRVHATLPSWVSGCVPKPPPGVSKVPAQRPDVRPCFARLAALGYRQRVTYQPAGNFWTLQWRETGVLLAAAGLLTGFCFWRIRRDLS